MPRETVIDYILTFITLLANSEDDKLVILFLFLPRIQDLKFHANCLSIGETICMKRQILFSGKIRRLFKYIAC